MSAICSPPPLPPLPTHTFTRVQRSKPLLPLMTLLCKLLGQQHDVDTFWSQLVLHWCYHLDKTINKQTNKPTDKQTNKQSVCNSVNMFSTGRCTTISVEYDMLCSNCPGHVVTVTNCYLFRVSCNSLILGTRLVLYQHCASNQIESSFPTNWFVVVVVGLSHTRTQPQWGSVHYPPIWSCSHTTFDSLTRRLPNRIMQPCSQLQSYYLNFKLVVLEWTLIRFALRFLAIWISYFIVRICSTDNQLEIYGVGVNNVPPGDYSLALFTGEWWPLQWIMSPLVHSLASLQVTHFHEGQDWLLPR